MLRGRRYKSVTRSVYVAADVPITLQVRAEAASLLVPEGVLSHHTALELWNAAGPADEDLHLSVQRDPGITVPRMRGLRVHEVGELECTTRGDLQLTPPDRTFVDLAASVGLVDLVAAGDSLVRRTHITPDAIRARATATTGVRGIRVARQAAGFVRGGVDSPMESRLRLLLVLAGLPEPEVTRPVYFSSGGWLAQPDLSYPVQRIAIEYDGRHHLTDARQWRNDIARREHLEREGWLIRVITATDMYRVPGRVITRIYEDLRQRRHPSLPSHPDFTSLHLFT